MDLNIPTINTEIPKWGETRFFGAYNPDENIGIYVHAGRFRKDLTMWWVHLAAFTPDGLVIVDRSWGPDTDRHHVRTGPFSLQQEQDGFTTTYNGIGEISTAAELAAAPRGSGAGLARVQWDVRFTDFAAEWDLYAGSETGGVHEYAGDSHAQRSYTTSGSVTIDGTTYAMDGVGWRDHSSGARDWSRSYNGHQFILAVNDTEALHAISMLQPDGTPMASIGALMRPDGSSSQVTHFLMEEIVAAAGGPTTGEIALLTEGAEEYTVRYELLHQLPIIINDNGDNMNGIDWENPVLSIVLCEAIARLTFPDGTIAHCFHERGIHRDRLTRPHLIELSEQLT